jgi:hypothetical protein
MEEQPAGSKLGFDDVMIRPRASTVRSTAEIEVEAETVFGLGGGDARRLTSIPLALVLSMPPDRADKNALPAIAGMRPLIVVRPGPASEAAIHGVEEGTIDPGLVIVASEVGPGLVGRIETVMERAKARCILVEDRSGSTITLIDACKAVRERYPNHILVAGEVQTSDALEAIARETDADIALLAPPCSAGPVGVPSFAMTIECVRAGRASGMRVMANVEKVDDVPKALAAGADFVSMPADGDTAPQIVGDAMRALRDVCVRTDCRAIKELPSKVSFLGYRKFA